MYKEQIDRILEKLEEARKTDEERDVFGSECHGYWLEDPISSEELQALEEKHSRALPSDYREFLLQAGNGGAGPFFGLFPLDEAFETFSHYRNSSEPLDTPDDWQWDFALERILDGSEKSNSEMDQLYQRFFQGLLAIGEQGCTHYHVIALEGEYAGRILNLDTDLEGAPRPAFETNFLDWYERWLDEVISGVLQREGYWFGYLMGGDEEELIRLATESPDTKTRADATEGMLLLEKPSPRALQCLFDVCSEPEPSIRHNALQILTRFDPTLASEPLRKHLAGDDADCLAAAQAIYRFAEDQATSWTDDLVQRLPRIESPETFRAAMYVLTASDRDCSDAIKPFSSHESGDIRSAAEYAIKSIAKKAHT